jgi:hypothetical protein
MKKILLFLVAFALLSIPAFAGTFPDVPDNHGNFDAIEYLYGKGIIQGYEDGTFKPDDLVNRAEALKIIVGAFGVNHEGSYESVFSDVKAEDWFFPYVMGGYVAEIINGYDDGSFKPGSNISLAELLKIVILSAKVELQSEVTEAVFADVPVGAWYAPYVLYARDHNVILPDEKGNIYADQPMTRAAFSEVVYRIMYVLENSGNAFPLDKNWTLYEGELLPFKIKYDDSKWIVTDNKYEVVFLWPDKAFSQFSPWRVYPDSGVVTIILDPNANNMNSTNYFLNVKSAFPEAKYTEFSLQGLSALEVLYPEKRIVDWYVYLGNGDVLVVYTEFGNGPCGYLLKQFVKSMLSTFEYVDKPYSLEDYALLLGEVFENVLHEARGMEMLDKFPDKIIIETDTIGVGTGPVDYYYSEIANYTFKYERSADMILDTREGKTSAF